jgi:hypothetical protein
MISVVRFDLPVIEESGCSVYFDEFKIQQHCWRTRVVSQF